MENICEWTNCNAIGKFKAPLERDNSKSYRWLCEEHIKSFNKNWNYFEGMSQKEIESFVKSDLTWHRPTQKFGSSDNFFKILWNDTLKDDADKIKLKRELNYMNKFQFNHYDIKAFSILGIDVGQKWEKIQERFKKLVKKFHPDMNDGNKKFEDKLKIITLAYTQLKNTYREKIDTKY